MASSSERTRSGNEADRSPGLSSRRWNLAAVGVFFLAVAAFYGETWLAGPTTTVPAKQADTPFLQTMTAMDISLETWLVARHAHTLVRRPHRLFDTEHCAPGENTLTLGIPMITMGVLGIPASLLTGDPLVTYNFSLVALSLIAAFAMYLLVAEWTGVPAAGIVAGLLYSFAPLRMANIHHPSVWDTSWTVLAIFFALRLFAHGRWRDAFGLALAGSLQLAASFYPLLGAVFLTPPFVVWLIVRYRFEHVKVAQLALVALAFVLAAAFVYGPYLEAKSASDILERTAFHYAPWHLYLPGRRLFVGWATLALVAAGFVLGRKRGFPALAGDPRPALLVGAFSVGLLAAGPLFNSVFTPFPRAPGASHNPYVALSGVLPGLDSVRGVMRLAADVHLVLMILAGMGAAALLRVCGPRARLAGPALIAVAALAVIRAPALGFERPYGWVLEELRPRPETLEFYEVLERKGNRGPIFELPDDGKMLDQPRRVLLNAYHGRRTSGCFASYKAPHNDQLIEIAGRLPEAPAVREVADMGFTTLVLHHHGHIPRVWKHRFAARAQAPGTPLRLVHATEDMTAFEITETAAAPRRGRLGGASRDPVEPE